jgi:hypothetical protein
MSVLRPLPTSSTWHFGLHGVACHPRRNITWEDILRVRQQHDSSSLLALGRTPRSGDNFEY